MFNSTNGFYCSSNFIHSGFFNMHRQIKFCVQIEGTFFKMFTSPLVTVTYRGIIHRKGEGGGHQFLVYWRLSAFVQPFFSHGTLLGVKGIAEFCFQNVIAYQVRGYCSCSYL